MRIQRKRHTVSSHKPVTYAALICDLVLMQNISTEDAIRLNPSHFAAHFRRAALHAVICDRDIVVLSPSHVRPHGWCVCRDLSRRFVFHARLLKLTLPYIGLPNSKR